MKSVICNYLLLSSLWGLFDCPATLLFYSEEHVAKWYFATNRPVVAVKYPNETIGVVSGCWQIQCLPDDVMNI
jgi:hypothetical protein